MAGYVRQDTGDNISNGSVIDADYLDQEYDAIEAAFSAATGHTHDGTTGGGAPITTVGPAQDFVASGAALYPKTDGAYTLGTNTNRLSVVYADQLTIGESNITWNTTDLTLDATLNGTGVTLQVGQEQLVRVQNNTGSTITNGTVVKYASAIGASGYFRVEPMQATAGTSRRLLLGVATEDIANGGVGFVTSQGFVRDINTSAWAAGTTLWVDPAVAGGLTPTEPDAPDLKLPIAVVTTQHATNGVLYVRVYVAGTTIAEDDLVELNSLANGDLLVYNGGNARFENGKALSGVTLSSSTISSLTTDLAIVDGGTGASTAAGALVNFGLTATASEINLLDGVTWSLTAYNGLLPTVTELNYVDGVTSNIQTQLNTLSSGKQAADATLTSISALGTAADKYLYTTGVDTWVEGAITAFARTFLDDADAATARTTLGALAKAGDSITGGMTSTVADDGTKSTGTYTPDPSGGNFKKIVNNGAFTLAAPTASGDYTLIIKITNGASAGTITFSGFTLSTGDDLTTTNAEKFFLSIVKCDGDTSVSVQALQ